MFTARRFLVRSKNFYLNESMNDLKSILCSNLIVESTLVPIDISINNIVVVS